MTLPPGAEALLWKAAERLWGYLMRDEPIRHIPIAELLRENEINKLRRTVALERTRKVKEMLRARPGR